MILTEGNTEPVAAKTATCVIRYRADEVVALLDSSQAGSTAGELLGVGGDIPVVASLAEADGANTLLIGIAPPGGKIPAAWQSLLLAAVERGLDIVSGLHDFVSDDPQLVAAAQQRGVRLVDVRRNDEHDVATGEPFRRGCLRIHTVGHDCGVGKMVVAMELARGLQAAGRDAQFLATGQTGILIEGFGCPVDCVVSDFVNGAVEKLVRAHQDREFLLIEGQGSLAHPRYSAVTLGLLHGCRPQGLILCYEVGRTAINGMEPLPLRSLQELRSAYETVGGLLEPCEVIGVAMNSRRSSAEEADAERERIEAELGLPACDVLRHGAGPLVDATLRLQSRLLQ